MGNNTNIQLFENKKVRSAWDAEQEKWYISIIDVIEVLTESNNPRRYWSDLKIKLEREGSQLYENIVQLKMQSSDGKFYKTDVARQKLELQTGKKVVSKLNAKNLKSID